MLTEITLILTLFAIGLLFIEKIITNRKVRKIGLRILVNGTRGKSSVTEYIFYGLSHNNNLVLGKVTGIVPTILLPDGQRVIKRKGRARVQEQVKIIRLSSKLKINKIVLECMSISPDLQKLESKILKPHIYVITNIKDDHREQMGKDIKMQVKAFCDAIPPNCKVVTNETTYINEIREVAASRNSTVVETETIDNTSIPEGVFLENIDLALKVCELAGEDKKNALRRIIAASATKGKSVFMLPNNSIFINGFAVNDVPSSINFISYWSKKFSDLKISTIVFNSRADRPLRSQEFAKWFITLNELEHIIILGDHKQYVKNYLLKKSLKIPRISVCSQRNIKNFVLSNFNNTLNNELIFGIGNIAVDGFKFVEVLSNIGTSKK